MKKILIILTLSSLIGAKLLTITGTVVSNNQKMIGARYMGYVKKINFDVGDYVHREDTLFELESAEFDILKNQADLAVEQAQLLVDVYRTKLDRIKKNRGIFKRLKNKDFSLDSLDDATANVSAGLKAAKAFVKSATTKAKQVTLLSKYLKVKAPNDGIIVQKRIRVGDMIAPGMLAMVLVDLKHLEIDAQIAESDLTKVNKGQKVEVTIPSLKYRTIGYVKTIVPSANPMTHTFTLIVRFKKTNEKIYPGMYAKIRLKY